ncbi:hypothetical protein MKW92_052648, partial [Papaver armeniacum]
DENVDCLYSVATSLNLDRYKASKIFYFLNCIAAADSVGEGTQDVGLLVIKHVNNFPPELLPPLHNILFNEVAQAPKHETTYLKLEVYLNLQGTLTIFLSSFDAKLYEQLNANQRKGASKSDSDEPISMYGLRMKFFISSWTFTFPSMISKTSYYFSERELQSLISES